MTAEIVIMNKHGIAMAADSAVTIESTDAQKTYNTVNKLFMLSKYNPVGIMIYGNSELLGVPWEIIIKSYRDKLGVKSFDSVLSYAQDFITYLETYFTEDDQVIFFTSILSDTLVKLIKKDIDREIEGHFEELDEISQEQVEEIVETGIQKGFEDASAWARTEALPDTFETQFLGNYEAAIQDLIQQVFEDLPISDQGQAKLWTIIQKACTTEKLHALFSGVVIAGFGTNEIFPALYAISINGVVNNHLIYRVDHDEEIDKKNSATIIPFAQGEMVATFLEGVDPRYDALMETYIQQIFEDYPNTLVENLVMDEDEKEKVLAELIASSDKITAKLKQDLIQFKRQEFTNKVINAVSFLPKDELAEMAESLVNLTSFKRRVTLDAETVGGPIDVAIVSKGDGFVWIKRKHYFEAKYNHHFFTNYYRSFNGTGGEGNGKEDE